MNRLVIIRQHPLLTAFVLLPGSLLLGAITGVLLLGPVVSLAVSAVFFVILTGIQSFLRRAVVGLAIPLLWYGWLFFSSLGGIQLIPYFGVTSALYLALAFAARRLAVSPAAGEPHLRRKFSPLMILLPLFFLAGIFYAFRPYIEGAFDVFWREPRVNTTLAIVRSGALRDAKQGLETCRSIPTHMAPFPLGGLQRAHPLPRVVCIEMVALRFKDPTLCELPDFPGGGFDCYSQLDQAGIAGVREMYCRRRFGSDFTPDSASICIQNYFSGRSASPYTYEYVGQAPWRRAKKLPTTPEVPR